MDLRQVDASTAGRLCSKGALDAGRRYCRDGSVRIRKSTRSSATAMVDGTCTVDILLIGTSLRHACTCKDDSGRPCGHAAAVLLYMADKARTGRGRGTTKGRIDSALRACTKAHMKEFLAKELARDDDLMARFESSLAPKFEPAVDIRAEMERMYRKAMGRSGIIEGVEGLDFDPITDMAKSYESDGRYEDAASVYQDLADVIQENMENVDDSYGNFSIEFAMAIEQMASCMARMESPQTRLWCITHLVEKFLEDDDYGMNDSYREALDTMCASKEDLHRYKSLLERQMPRHAPAHEDNARRNVLVRKAMLMIDLLEKVRDESVIGFCKSYHGLDPRLCDRCARYLKDGASLPAPRGAPSGIGAFARQGLNR